jgi:GTPase SAR1 family protein
MDQNPFVAVSGQPPRLFRGRAVEERAFLDSLARADAGPSKHLVVLGDWGIGKTSLLRQFKHLAQADDCRGTLIPIPNSRFGKDAAEAIRLIAQELDLAFPQRSNNLERLRGIEFTVLGTGGGVTFSDRTDKQPQILLTGRFRDSCG